MIQDCSMNFPFPVLQGVQAVTGLPPMKLDALMALSQPQNMNKSSVHE